MTKRPVNPPSGLSRRLHFPEDEQRLPWLAALLDAAAIADTGVSVAVRDAEKKQRKKLACRPECDVCCHQPDIPVYPHELPGLRWYAVEKTGPSVRGIILHQLTAHRKGSPCPFLVEHSCAVHPLRPIACRQYNVLTTICAPGEDPYYSRRSDVLAMPAGYTDRAFAAVAAFYGMSGDRDAEAAVRRIKERIMNLQEQDWSELIGDLRAATETEPPAGDQHR